jgi:hypothetical protein
MNWQTCESALVREGFAIERVTSPLAGEGGSFKAER